MAGAGIGVSDDPQQRFVDPEILLGGADQDGFGALGPHEPRFHPLGVVPKRLSDHLRLAAHAAHLAHPRARHHRIHPRPARSGHTGIILGFAAVDDVVERIKVIGNKVEIGLPVLLGDIVIGAE